MGIVEESHDALSRYASRSRRDNGIEAETAVRLHAEALGEARRLASEMAKADPTLRKVLLFGSALPGMEYRVDSDIDLAISGGNRALLERVAERSGFRVDIIAIEDARPGIRERIATEGLVIYEATEG